MKTKDVLEALGDVKDEYKKEASEENADKYFKKGNGFNVLKFVLSGAALLGLAAFAVLVVSTKYTNKVSMVAADAYIEHNDLKFDIIHETLTPAGVSEGRDSLSIPRCELKGGEAREADASDPLYIISGGVNINRVYHDYTLESKNETTYFVKTENGKEVYSYKLPGLAFYGYRIRSDGGGVILVMFDQRITAADSAVMFIALDNDGKELWRASRPGPSNGLSERIAGAEVAGDRLYTVTYVCDEETLNGVEQYRIKCKLITVSEYSLSSGELLKTNGSDVDFEAQLYGVRMIALLKDGYYVLTWQDAVYNNNVILLDFSGNIRSVASYVGFFEFCSAGCSDGEIYLSGKLMSPARNMNDSIYYERDVSNLKYDYTLKRSKLNGEMLEKYKEETTAVLLVCGEDLTPKRIYTQKGAFGGTLYNIAGVLSWDVCEISSVYASRSDNPEKTEEQVIISGKLTVYGFNDKNVISSRDYYDITCSAVGFTVTAIID